ncbi:MAG: hypothetical protein MUC98_06205 [Desulfobacterota bacterium]|nr:hypothetical protein [Thermodesulfobacteriota bacterium]
MEEESTQKTNALGDQNSQAETFKEQPPENGSTGGNRGGQKGVGWPVWLLVCLMGLLLASSIGNLAVSYRAYESSQKQVTAIEQLTQSIKDTQRAIMDLARMLEQPSSEEEEPEEDRGAAGDGSI